VSFATWISLAGLAATLLFNLAAHLVAWGALNARVKALEAEVGCIDGLRLELAKISERQEIWIEQLRDLNASVRWMREPAGPTAPPRRGG
jgi:hypothetical protein